MLVDGGHGATSATTINPAGSPKWYWAAEWLWSPGGQVDVAQGDRLDALLGEERFGGLGGPRPAWG